MDRRFASLAGLALEVILCDCSGWPRHAASPEMLALAGVKQLASAEIVYHNRSGRYGSLTELKSDDDEHISGTLKLLGSADYTTTVQASPGAFTICAVPIRRANREVVGRRSFFTDETLVIRESWVPNKIADRSNAPVK
jgi:hypothetical protein